MRDVNESQLNNVTATPQSSASPQSASSSEAEFARLGGWATVLSTITAGSDLSSELAVSVFSEILEGRATAAQIAGFAIGMRTKGESVDELTAVLRTMVAYSVPVPLAAETLAKALCTCGTGGDRSRSINISTTASFVVAGAGGVVCKHGGRASSSASGSADVLEALGVALDLTPEGVARCVEETGMGFCLAPRFHPAMRHAGPIRKELGTATLFNFLGPMANPGRVRRQAVGVSDPRMARKMIQVLRAQGAEMALVMFGHDGLDELSTVAPSTVLRLEDGEITESTVQASDFGLATVTPDALLGGSAAENAVFLQRVLDGEAGPHRDVVVLNAAAGLVVAGLCRDLEEGVRRGEAAIDDGSARRVLDDLIRVSNEALAN